MHGPVGMHWQRGLTTEVALTELLVAVNSITHDVQCQHHSTLLALQHTSMLACAAVKVVSRVYSAAIGGPRDSVASAQIALQRHHDAAH